MESIAYVYHSASLAGAEFDTVGELRLKQKAPVPYKGVYRNYNVCLL